MHDGSRERSKELLSLTQVGNDQMAFTRNTLAPLVKPGMTVYAELKRDIFGHGHRPA